MAASIPILIHTGLPWVSPQRIIISSAEYISNAVINRGLLNLLNNDYYLDLKAQAINQYIQDIVVNHIGDTSIHVPWSRITSFMDNIKVATANIAYYIPLWWNDQQQQPYIINEYLKKIPKMLNGHTVLICFCRAYSSNQSVPSSWDRAYQLDDASIQISNFINGNVIIYGTREPVILQGPEFANLQIKQQTGEDMIQNLSRLILDYDQTTKGQYSINFRGTARNGTYSVMSISDCQASVYVFNLKIQHYLKNDGSGSDVFTMPSDDSVLLCYQLGSVSGNYTPANQQYLNENYLYQNASYSLYVNNPQDIIGADVNKDKAGVSAAVMKFNSAQALSGLNSPQYLCLDSGDSFSISQQLRRYFYQSGSDFTMTFGGILDDDTGIRTASPVFADYSIDENGTDKGLYVSLDQVYRSPADDDPRTDRKALYGKAGQVNRIAGRRGLYVLQFIHYRGQQSGVQIKTQQDESVYLWDLLNDYQPASGHMWINLSFVYKAQSEDPEPYRIVNLLPDVDAVQGLYEQAVSGGSSETIQQNLNKKLQENNYEIMTLPDSWENQIKLFACPKINSGMPLLRNWDYFSGAVRNLHMFRKRLKRKEIFGLLQNYWRNSFNWTNESENQLKNRITEKNISLAALYSYKNSDLNLILTTLEADNGSSNG